MKKHSFPSISLTAAAILAAASLTCQAAPTVSFTLSVNAAVDPGVTFTNFTESDKGTGSVQAIGFQIKVTQIDGVTSGSEFNDPFTAFCTELQESISTSSYTFGLVPLENVSAGQAGVAGTASYLIPVGGIGSDRAAMVRYLFDTHYQSPTMSKWSSAASFEAFQLALWEVTHDTNLDIVTPSTNGVYVATQNNATRDNVIALAQEILGGIKNAGVDASYKSKNYSVWGLVNAGNPGNQDILIGVPYKSTQDTTLNELVPVHTPEPGTLVLLSFASAATLMRRRRR